MELEELVKLFSEILKINRKTLLFVLGVIVSNLYIDSDPVWGIIVGPLGRTKTELLNPFRKLPEVIWISKFRKESLVSGLVGAKHWRGFGILQKLKPDENYIMVIKDFSSILSLHPEKMAEVFGILREIYDGDYTEGFGNELGLVNWQGKIGVIGACTGAIDQAHSFQQKHGSRFLYWRIKSRDVQDDIQLTKHVLNQTGSEKSWRDRLQMGATDFFSNFSKNFPTLIVRLDDSKDKITSIATFAAYARSYVHRDGYGNRDIEAFPDLKAPTRLAKELTNLGTALAMLSGEDRISNENFSILVKCAIDSVPRVRVEILRALSNGAAQLGDISRGLRFPNTSTKRILEDLRMVGHVEEVFGIWQLSSECESLIKGAGFVDPKELWSSIQI